MLAIYILLQQTLICLFCSLWFCLFVSAACSSACWWQRGYRLMMVVALICLAEKYRANRMQHCRPEIGSSVDNIGFQLDHELVINCNNQQTIRLLTKDLPTLVTKLKHVDIRQHWLR